MRALAALVLLNAACGTRAGSQAPDACVPGAGAASFLAGSWVGVPESPSDFGVDLSLKGSAEAICGFGFHWAGGLDAGTPFDVSGTEQTLQFHDVPGEEYLVIPRDATHFALGSDAGAQLEFTRR